MSSAKRRAEDGEPGDEHAPETASNGPQSPDETPPEGARETADGGGGKRRRTTARGARVGWTFLTNHSHVLVLLYAKPALVVREIAASVGITERAVQQIILDLEEGGYVVRERVGRQNRYHVKTDDQLRHPIEAHCRIEDLLALIVSHPAAGENEHLRH